MPCPPFTVDSSGNIILEIQKVKIPVTKIETPSKNYFINNELLDDILNNSNKGLQWMLRKYSKKENFLYGEVGIERKSEEEKKKGYTGLAGEVP